MRVRVLYFGVLKDMLACSEEEMSVGEGITVAALLSSVCERGGIDPVWARSLAVAVNREYAGGYTVLRDGDEVAILPPVSGGADAR